MRKTKDKKDMHTLHHISTTVALQKIQVQKRQKDIHPAQTQHNTQQENSTRVKCTVDFHFKIKKVKIKIED